MLKIKENAMMQYFNTLTGKKETLIVDKPIKIYVCGVTPYDNAHVGHGRCYVSFDLLQRTLRFFGADVLYCRNFTDIDDKIMHRAEKELGSRLRYREIADKYIDSFKKDIALLNCEEPDVEPRVTDNIEHIIHFIQDLINQGSAYQSGNNVYFRIESFSDYGKLSKQNIEDLHAGVRVNSKEDKKNPLDFALWKGEPEGEFWLSPWGYGRPGWHIECSVLARLYLDKHIDIHGGGLDLIFPHHENEIAQSESLFGAPLARIWVHNGMVNSNKEKMSKSLGNFFVLHDLFKQFDPMVVRYYFLIHHYRMPIEFSFEALAQAQKSYERLVRLCAPDCSLVDISGYQSDIGVRMSNFLQDDLNTPGLFGVIFEHITAISHNIYELAVVKRMLVNVLGLNLLSLEEERIITPEIQSIIDARNKARQDKNWALADELRDQLEKYGFDIHDHKIIK